MKPETKVWLKCESIGRPADTFVMQCSAREAVKVLASWLMGVYMGSKIRILMARTEAELCDDRRSAANQDVMRDLESILGPEPELACVHGNTPNDCGVCKVEEAL
jgi:hypothetical protein